jgi:hypothetical protein
MALMSTPRPNAARRRVVELLRDAGDLDGEPRALTGKPGGFLGDPEVMDTGAAWPREAEAGHTPEDDAAIRPAAAGVEVRL